MKYNIIVVLFFLLFSCAKEQEVKEEVDLMNADAQLNHYWDLYEAHKSPMPDSALYYMQEIKVLAEATDKKAWIAAAYVALGDIYRKGNNLGESAFYYLKAIKHYKEQGELKRLAVAYTSLGLIYEGIEDYEKAIFYAQQAEDIFFYEGNSCDKANIYRNLALYHSQLSHLTEAEEYINLSQRIALNAQDYGLLGKIYNTAGVVNFKLENYDKARQYYQLAIQTCDSLPDLQWTKAAATSNIGEAYFHEKKYEQAERWLIKALPMINDPVLKQITLNLYGEMLVEQGKYREAVGLLQGNFSRAGLSETSPAIDEGLGLIQEALTKIAAENKAENVAYLSRNFAALNAYSREYATQARKLREELQTLSKQLSVQANVEKYAQQEEAEQAARKNLQIILIAVFLLLSAVVAIVWVMRKNRRYKELYSRVEDILNSQALRHIKKG